LERGILVGGREYILVLRFSNSSEEEVENIPGLSPAKVFHSVLGDHDVRLGSR
jgi:hypothetical protein